MVDGKNKGTGFEDLEVWQYSIALSKQIYQITGKFPREEIYGLTNQMRRCSVSIASNLAEGSVRGSKYFSRFVTMSLGSSAELKTQLIIAKEIGFLKETEYKNLLEDANRIGRMLKGLKSSLRERV